MPAKRANSNTPKRSYTKEENFNYLSALGIRLKRGYQASAEYIARLAGSARRREREGEKISARQLRGHTAGEYQAGVSFHVQPQLVGRHKVRLPAMWRAGPVVRGPLARAERSRARRAGAIDVLHALAHIRGQSVRLAVFGIWRYKNAAQRVLDWYGVRVSRRQLRERLEELRQEVDGFRAANVAAGGHGRELARVVNDFEQTQMVDLANDLFAGDPFCEAAFAWTVAESPDKGK